MENLEEYRVNVIGLLGDENPLILIGSLDELKEIENNSQEMIDDVEQLIVGPSSINESINNSSKKGDIPGISNITSKRDDKGNININATYDLNSYKCCVCFESIIGAVISCDNGHPMCRECTIGVAKSGDNRCPVCRSTIKGRNYLLENVLAGFTEQCPFSKNGCKHMTYPEDMKEHISICQYTDINCPWCKENTTSFDLKTHTEFKCNNFTEIS
jgi:hypothetical protein